MEEINEVEETFAAASDFVKANAGNFSSDSLLLLYSRYKQAKEGKCKTSRPGFFDFQGKQKWDAWSKLGNMKKHVAMLEYNEEVSRVHPEWESQLKCPEKPPKSGPQNSLGVAVSVMVNTDNDIDDELKTMFDWCKEGNMRQVSRLLDEGDPSVDTTDSEGLSLLHWACDRGDCDMVEMLLRRKASINLQDGEEQTPLHFAVICEHPQVVRCLINHGARTDIRDCDGQTVLELETTSEIKLLLTSNPVR